MSDFRVVRVVRCRPFHDSALTEARPLFRDGKFSVTVAIISLYIEMTNMNKFDDWFASNYELVNRTPSGYTGAIERTSRLPALLMKDVYAEFKASALYRNSTKRVDRAAQLNRQPMKNASLFLLRHSI